MHKCSEPELVHVTARALIIEIQLHTAPLRIRYNKFGLNMTLTRSWPEIKTIKKSIGHKLHNATLMQGAVPPVPQSAGTAVAELVFS
jgi:hypothetical protein